MQSFAAIALPFLLTFSGFPRDDNTPFLLLLISHVSPLKKPLLGTYARDEK
jgi:hypothetical protein